jgi:sec-independent protein translocase protein TatC
LRERGEEASLPIMPFMEHLADLRRVLIVIAVIFLVGSSAGWMVSNRVILQLTKLLPDGGPAHVFSPPEAFLIRLKVSAALALFVGLPLIMFQLWRFLAPGLYRHEKRRLVPLFVFSTLLFYAGTAYAYLVLLPIFFRFFYGLLGENVTMTPGLGQLFDMVAKLCLAFGVAFQLPIVIFVLTMLGLASPRWLLRQWRLVIIALLIVSAVLTPTPDMITQLAMALPLTLLYLISVLVALPVQRRRQAAQRGSVDTPENL